MAITESWLKSYIQDAQVKIPDYTPLRADRHGRKCGGAMLLVHNRLLVSNPQSFDNGVCEAVICTIPSMSAVVASVYRPPDTTLSEFLSLLQFLDLYLKDAVNDETNDVLILGDFNFPGIDWQHLSYARTTKDQNASSELLLEFMSDHLLAQCVDKSTRGDAILDLILTNNDRAIGSIKSSSTCLSDHNLVEVVMKYNPLKGTKAHVIPKWDPHSFRGRNLVTAEFDNMNDDLSKVDWSSMMTKCEEDYDGDKDGSHFVHLLRNTVLETCISNTEPKKSGPVNKGSRNKRILIRRKKKLKARLLALKSKNPQSEKIKKLENELFLLHVQLKDVIFSELAGEEQRALDSIRVNPKFFYSYAKRFSKVRCNVGPLIGGDGCLTNNPSSMADILQTQYNSVFSDPANPNKVIPPLVEDLPQCITDISLTVENVEEAIDDIRANAGTSENDIPAVILKQCKAQLSYPIFAIWKKSKATGLVPQVLKEQYVAPVFKKGEKTDPANYRPVALTSHLIKIYERIVRKQIVAFLEENNSLSSTQHGFRQGRSCLTQLLHHYDNLLKNLCNGEVSDVLYLDFSKAFDKVDHEILLRKVWNIGIRGKLFDWIADFLRDRTQTVQVDGFLSFWDSVLSSVPQGTVLGPLLFIIYVNDLEQTVRDALIGCFADDTRLTKAIRGESIEADMFLLQVDLHRVIRWALENNMELNESKFDLLCYSFRPAAALFRSLPFTQSLFEYETPSGTRIQSTNSVRDLGVNMSPDYTWSAHVAKVAAEGKKTLSWVLSVFRDRSKLTMLTLYNSLVRSKLEYCCPLWNPSAVADIQKLENVQRVFTSRVAGCKDLAYWERLKALKIQSLQRRRERYVIIHTWKILNNLTNNDIGLSFTDTENSSRTGVTATVPHFPRNVPTRVVSLYEQSFAVKAPKLWNCLPKHVKGASTLAAFKGSLGDFLNQIPDMPPSTGYTGVNHNSILDWAKQNNRI